MNTSESIPEDMTRDHTMERRTFMTLVSGGLLAAPRPAEAEQAGKVWRVGFLEAGSSSVNRHFLDAFRQGLSELGYVEGHQIVVDDRWAEGRAERFPGLLTELIGLKVDIIVVSSNVGAVAAKTATRTIPTIFVAVGDPLGLGLVVSLSRPGGNSTGLSTLSEEFSAKWVELLKEVVPRSSVMAVGRVKESDLRIPLVTYGTGRRQGILHGADVSSPRDDRRLARQSARGHQRADLGAKLSLGHRLVSKGLIGSLPALFLADLRGQDL